MGHWYTLGQGQKTNSALEIAGAGYHILGRYAGCFLEWTKQSRLLDLPAARLCVGVKASLTIYAECRRLDKSRSQRNNRDQRDKGKERSACLSGLKPREA